MSVNKFKHSSLTHFMRRNCDPNMVASILARCDVSPRVGCLPPQLVPLVRPQNRANVTNAFGLCLENFFVNNIDTIRDLKSDMVFSVPDISALFSTECVIASRGVSVFGVCPWSGGFGVVCKVSFPKIHAEYALKYFLESGWHKGHGAVFEISTAFAANHAEPRDNCPIYMASLNPGCEFMLSQWAGDVNDGIVRDNKYGIYSTSDDERHPRNWRGGRRIDYGETYQTDYGKMSYSERKLFRKILRAADMGYDSEFEYMYNIARHKRDRECLDHVMQMAQTAAFMNDQYKILDVIERNMKSNQH